MAIDILTLAAARAGGTGGSASKYQQPEWGAETAIVELLPETELSIMSEDESMAIVQQKVTLIGGAVYTVNYNGTEYECTAYEGEDGDIVMLGNAAAVDGEDTGEPFFLVFYDDTIAAEIGCYGAVVPLDGSTMFTLSIKGEGEVVHAIPEKYIGNAAMRVTVSPNTAGVLVPSKTFSQIITALEAGIFVYVYVEEAETGENWICTPGRWTETAILFFVGIKGVKIQSDNTVSAID